jgi:hypothetical protein
VLEDPAASHRCVSPVLPRGCCSPEGDDAADDDDDDHHESAWRGYYVYVNDPRRRLPGLIALPSLVHDGRHVDDDHA